MFEFFKEAAQTVSQGLDWGKTAAQDGWSATKEFSNEAANAAKDAAVAAAHKVKVAAIAAEAKVEALARAAAKKIHEGYDATKQVAGQAVDKVRQAALDAEARVITTIAENVTAYAVADAERFSSLHTKLDKRDRFSSKVCVACAANATKHPDKRDGQFLGADCPDTHANKPGAGAKPKGCACDAQGKPLPKIMFTNGINNNPEQVCETMHALANSRCAEVTTVFNATYADESLTGPARRAADYLDALKSGGKGAVKGGLLGAVIGGLPGILGGVAKGMVTGALPEVGLQEASRLGLVQDVLDCVDTINHASVEAATKVLAKEIVDTLNGPDGKMTLYAHSQGGLNAAAAIAQAKRELIASEKERLEDQGVDPALAKARAKAFAEGKLAKLDVSTFGTLERGLPDGPNYSRYTNPNDPVPKVIKAAQEGLVPEEVKADPVRAALVNVVDMPAQLDSMAAHGMIETYIPWLTNTANKGQCC